MFSSRFKFFSTTRMMPLHVQYLRKSRKVLVSEKVLVYETGEFFEHVQFEKPIFVLPAKDWLLDELDHLEIGENGEYDFGSLSTDFKKYMRLKDDEFFNKEFAKWKNAKLIEEARQGREIERVEEYFDRGLFESELETILSGQKVAIETPSYIKAMKSNRRAYKTVLELIRANLNSFECFITLTFALKENEQKYLENGSEFDFVEDTKDFEAVKKVFSNFAKTLSTNLRRNEIEFEYIAVYEEHRDGRFHFHMVTTAIPEEYLVACPEWLDMDYKKNERRNGKMLSHWNFGKSDVEVIRDKERMSTYLCKYLVKNFQNLVDDDDSYKEFMGKKKYFASRGLKRPAVEYFHNSDEQKMAVLTKRKDEYKDIYSTTYRNPYSDSEIERTICSKVL